MKKKVIAWWSGGITSAVACWWAIEAFNDVEVVFIDTKGNEHSDTYRFLNDCEKLYGQKIDIISNKEYKSIKDVWRKYKSLNTAKGAICSSELKRKMREKHQDLSIHWAQVFGFEHDKSQIRRHFNMRKNYPEINALSPLIDIKWNKQECKAFFREVGVKIPETYNLGFENNNCFKTGCVQGGIGYWQKIKTEYPVKFFNMAAMEHELTDKKGSPVTICKDQSEGKTRLIFLKPHPDYPEIKHIGMIKGLKPMPIPECIGFCATSSIKNA